MTDFVHLHLHSEYSLLDGAIQFEHLAGFIRDNGMSSVALTDHGNLCGAVHFHDLMVEQGVKPIIGFEAYLCPEDMTDRSPEVLQKPYYHLTLIARNMKGYRNLCRLSSLGYLKGFYRKPRIDRETLSRYSEGILIGSACLQGEVAQHLLKGRDKLARDTVRFYQDLVGKEHFFIELMDHGLEEEKRIIGPLAELAGNTEAIAAATNDAHYLRQEDAGTHEILLCIQTGKTLEDERRMRFGSNEFYVKTPSEMQTLFSWYPESVSNTVRLAEMCDFTLEKGELLLPRFDLPGDESDLDSYLRKISFEGLEKKLGRSLSSEDIHRLDHELKLISEMDFPGYFLIVSELMQWARSCDIPVGPGRGSAAGSLVSYSIGITDVNPLDYDLSFERFLNPAREEMPDIDLDVCYERRGEVIEHIIRKYGSDRVCQIISFNRIKNRSAVRDVARVMGMTYDEGDRLAKLVSSAPDPDAPIKEVIRAVPELMEASEKNDSIRILLQHAGRLRNIARHSGVHAAGVVIAPGDLMEYVPLQISGEKGVTTQFEKKSAEKIGLLKLDVLGLRTATVIHHAEQLVKRQDPSFDIRSVPFDDPDTLSLLSRGETTAVFQLESTGMREALRKIGVDRFDDVTAAVAIYRPGSMHMIDMYAENKKKVAENDPDSKIACFHPDLEKILSETYGVIIYQEQVMRIANVLASMSMVEADILRQAMSRKNPEVMSRIRKSFLDGAISRGVASGIAGEVFDHIEKFAGYGFNKSHAVCYSILSYRTAWLKVHYPSELMASSLTSEIGNIDKLSVLFDECRKLGVQILPPSVNSSSVTFDVDDQDRIIFALSAIKNVGSGPSAAIVNARREGGVFRDIFDLCSRQECGNINRKVLESLILCGAADALDGNRAQLISVMDKALEYGAKVKRHKAAGQMSLFGKGSEDDTADVAPSGLPPLEELPIEEILESEKFLLGFYLTGHPLDVFQEELAAFATDSVMGVSDCRNHVVSIGGRVASRRIVSTRRGDMAFVTIEDRNGGSSEIVVFSEALEKYGELLERGSLILLEGEIVERKGERKFSVKQICRLRNARTVLNAGIRVLLDGGNVDYNALERAVCSIRKKPGNGPVLVLITHPSGWKVFAGSRSMRISPDDDLLDELRELLGRDAVHLTRGSGAAV